MMSQSKRTDPVTVAVFARVPEPGKVKTRLAASVGADAAASLAAAFLRDTWSALTAIDWVRPVVATTGPLGLDFHEVAVWSQGTGDLGSRIERVLQRALDTSPCAFAIGADTPGLPTRLLEQARAALASADAVLGPCDDGGFYLIGVRGCPTGLLADLPWSQPDTFARVRERLQQRGLVVAVIEHWFDVDRGPDLTRLERLIADGVVIAPATARALAACGRPVAPAARISVVIPTLNEGARIARRLTELGAMTDLHEVIVVDGGSSDRTVAIARDFAGARVIEGPRGRAKQMNQGAKAATGDVLLFLHADVSLPADATRWVAEALRDKSVVAGAFRTHTIADAKAGWSASLLRFADLRSRYSSLPYGDQALFVRAPSFRAVGGFPAIALMEDLALSRRLRELGRIRTVAASVRVSGRRFMARPIYYTLLVNVMPLLFRLGVPPATLASWYGDPR